ncbi:hypothetical protein [Agromyces archimandritae]|uniref:Uncharacterized protein n=1 Tax=Agromyces archimandritae TaxID=2781962 RepID=A0A975FMQ4_9MICO|nr:hypothetical protein [Agromyces archimandritae]QTX05280.1 hypothetical protein G127AT_03355 [Agromyces archimandritae]
MNRLTQLLRGAKRRAGTVSRLFARVHALEAELAEARADIDELRRDNRRIAELADFVMTTLKEERTGR